MKTLDWYECYNEGWTNEIVGEAFSHPAKFARGLIRRIYEHALERGYLAEGDAVLDPFAGVALGALDALFYGLHWTGVELEDKFVSLGQQNIDLWNSRYDNGMLPRWGTATLLQGDSRDLLNILGGARAMACVSSPPYANARIAETGDIMATMRRSNDGQRYGDNPRNLGNMREGDVDAVISSPPYGDITNIGERRDPNKSIEAERRYRENHPELEGIRPKPLEPYGDSEGQLGAMAMQEGDFRAIVSSPPYSGQTVGSKEYHARMKRLCQQPLESLAPRWQREVRKYLRTQAITSHSQITDEGYGQSPGQLAAMPEGAFEATAVVSSPPYECSRTDQEFQRKASNINISLSMPEQTKGYGNSDLGRSRTSEAQNTFWSAARQVVQQCHQVLVPGGVAVWVLKAFVRNKAIVDFPNQWRRMCEACGFETLEWIRAWLVEDRGAQYALNGDLVEKQVHRKSFFRRLHEKKYPGLSIDFEVVLVTRKAEAI